MKPQIKNLLDDIYLLAKNDNHGIESKLSMYQFCASSFWHNYSGTFVHHQLEEDLIQISENIIDCELDISFETDHILHVMTEAYDTGGHTRVVENWIKATPHRHSVFFNNPHSSIPTFLENAVTAKNGSIILNDKNGFVEKAKFLAQIASRFKYIVLHHHPYDILPLLAFGTHKFSRPIFFYNHADHVWGCGYSVSDCLIEICQQGVQHSIKYRGIPENKVIFGGIPISLPEKSTWEIDKTNNYIISMASAYKFKPIENLSFQDFIDKILSEEPNVEYYAIGVSPSDESWQVLQSKYPTRVYLKGILQKEDAHALIQKATLYLDSFPLGSSTSLIEAMSLGIPVLAYASPIQYMDAYRQYSYSDLDELFAESIRILHLSDNERFEIATKAWDSIKQWHSRESFFQRIQPMDQIEQHYPIRLSKFIVTDNYIQHYTDFMYQLLSQQHFKFDPGQLHLLTYDQKKKLTISISLYNLLENSIPLYGNEDWYDLITQNIKLFSQLFLDSGNGFSEENSIKLAVAKNTDIQEFVFDLSDKPALTALRLDPLNDSCVIDIEKCVLTTDHGEIDLCVRIASNALIYHGNSYLFDHNDPQIYFNDFSLDKLDVKRLIVKIRFAHIGKDALQMCVNQIIMDKDHIIASKGSELDQTKIELDQTKTELDQTKIELDQTKIELDQTKTELDQMLSSHSWRITKPLRKIKQLFKGN